MKILHLQKKLFLNVNNSGNEINTINEIANVNEIVDSINTTENNNYVNFLTNKNQNKEDVEKSKENGNETNPV